jgi:transposase
MSPREERGLILAARLRGIKRKGKLWHVPSSQVNQPAYLVNLDLKSCTCLDHQEGGEKCKHIWAAEIVFQREFEFDDDGERTEPQAPLRVEVPRKTYPQNWPAYDRAQINEKSTFQVLLRDLCNGIVEPKSAMGRPRIALTDSIFAVVFKVYSTVSGRRFMSDLRDARDKGHVSRVPAYSSIFTVLESEETADVLKSLIIESANPLKAIESHFSCDSSGFSGCRFDKWFDHKWGDIRTMRAWVKAHIMTGAKTNVVTAVEIHDQHAADTKQLKPLLNSTLQRFNVQELSADMAYLSQDNLQTVVDAGATPLIPFQARNKPNYPGVWNKAYHYFHMHREEFMARYHKRSNIESTFSMMKAKFGDGVRSKTDVAMKNEVLAKILCHNICCLISAIYELGIAPTFWTESSLVQKVAGA